MSSYVLDRELMLSAAACLSARRPQEPTATTTTTTTWIDANSNASLLGTSVYQRNTDTETRKQMADVYL